ncbi:MAG: hypothetical protein ACK5SZ_02240 [bacterium]
MSMDINRITAPIPFAAAKAYGVASRPVTPARVDRVAGMDAATVRGTDQVNIQAKDAMRARVANLVAAKVEERPFAAEQPAPRDPSVLQFYRHPADRNAAAVQMQGNRVDVTG